MVIKEYRDDTLYYHHTRDEKPDPASFKIHDHDQYEIFYFISGQGNFYVEGSEYPLHIGDLVILRGAEAHYIDVDSNTPYERFVLHFNKSILNSVDGEQLLLRPFDDREAGRKNLFRKHDFKSDTYARIISGIMNSDIGMPRLQGITVLFALLGEINTAANHSDSSSPVHERETLASSVIGYINDHLDEHISLDDICSRFYVSKAQLCRSFKKTTGTTVGNYVTVKRLVAANNMILSGTPATSAFAESGFGDYSTFYRAYRKHFGHSPIGKRYEP